MSKQIYSPHKHPPGGFHDASNQQRYYIGESQQGGSVDHYTIGWICALQEEYDSACRMLDEELDDLEALDEADDNTYTFGCIDGHYVVIGCLPLGRYGTNSASRVARDMVRSFPSLRFALMVGIGGGLPTSQQDIRLGDVVVGIPSGTSGGVIQYDLGKVLAGGVFQPTGHLNAPPEKLLGILTKIRQRYNDPRKPDRVGDHIRRMDDMPDYRRPALDCLYQSDYTHRGGPNCEFCDRNKAVERADRGGRVVAVHYGTIASGNTVIKDAITRDQFANSTMKPLCFEMEAAGLMNNLACLVIRGICDYSDSHKNDEWHKYAALTAAAYAREMLLTLKPQKVALLPAWSSESLTCMTHIAADVRQMRTSIDDARICRWLSPADPSTNFNGAMQVLEPGTGNWLFEHKAYMRWRNHPGSLIWLHGKPGSGKTVLTSLVIDDCMEVSSPAIPANSLLYFYFDFADSGKRTHNSMVRSIIWQLAGRDMDTMNVLGELFEACDHGQKQPSQKDLYDTFGKMMSLTKGVYLVVDGLDECSERENMLWLIQKFNTWYQDKIHLCVSSRQEKDINERLQSMVGNHGRIELSEERVNKDIALYLRQRLENDPRLDKWKRIPTAREEIHNKIMSKADGMFRWAMCQLTSVGECLDRQMLRNRLAGLPRTLEETYLRIISNIADCHKAYALRILQWLLYAVRPLLIEELVDVIAVNLDEEPSFDPQDRLLDVEDILSICSSLVTIETSGSMAYVRLSHMSVRDYLVSDNADAIIKDYMAPETAHTTISSICLKYILSENHIFTSSLNFPLTDYAAKHWPGHARAANEAPESLLKLMKDLFFSREDVFSQWLDHLNGELNPRERSSVHTLDDGSPLFFASSLGLVKLVRVILDRGTNPDTYCADYGSGPIHEATAAGHVDVVYELLKGNADPDLPDQNRGTALQIASHGGHKQIVQHLLAHGGNPDHCGGKYHSPLQEALYSSHEQVAIALVKHGADPNTPCQRYGSALQLAVARDFTQLAENLLNKGANANANNGIYGTALQLAAEKGNERIFRSLVDHGADLNLSYRDFDTPLRKALHNSHASIVEILLDAGAEPHPQICGTALELAAYQGCIRMVQTLLKSVPHTSSYRGHYSVALWMASSQGHVQVVHKILEHCRDISPEFLNLAVEWAGKNNHYEIYKLLLIRERTMMAHTAEDYHTC